MKQNCNATELASCAEVTKHIKHVKKYLRIITKKLKDRGLKHDQSKMEDPEVAIFAEYTPKLKKSTYGSDEYNNFLNEMKVALDHHYAQNRHHPEHFKSGIDDMNLVDLIEMLCDWKAATLKHNDGNILKSLDINSKRFNMSPQTYNILKNTVEQLFEEH